VDRRIPASARRPHRRPAAHRPAAPHPVLELQQLAGNRAVAARLAGGPHSVQRRLPGPEVTTSPAITELTPAGQVARAQQLQDMIRGQLAQLPPDTSLNITNAFYDHGLIISKPVTEYASTAEALTALRNMLTIIRAEAPTATRPGDRPNSRPSGPEKLALQGMIIQAKAIFNAVAGGHADQQITTVFNPANAGDAARVRGTFAAAAAALQRLYDSDVIFLDTRGDLQTKGVGALTGTGSMTLPAGFARAATPDGVQVLLHESFHAVDSGIIDKV
jgi:hypothetical protein